MANQFGPWATLIDTGGSPQLSAFWRRRMTMLVPTSQTSPVLSRRNLLWLWAVVVLTLAVPTFHTAPVAADENKSAEKTSSDDGATAKAHPNSHSFSAVGVGVFSTRAGEVDAGYLWLPTYVHSGLCYPTTRNELNITSDQEKKLREISVDALKRSGKMHQEMNKLTETLTPAERAAKRRELQTRLVQQSGAVRVQIEQVLTLEQLKALRSEAIGMAGAGQLLFDATFREKIGLSDQQWKELSKQLYDRSVEERAARSGRFLKENDEKTMAVISPQQWQQIERLFSSTWAGEANPTAYPGREWQALSEPNFLKQLALSAEQQAKLREIEAKSQTQSRELSKLVDGINDSLLPRERAGCETGRVHPQTNHDA